MWQHSYVVGDEQWVELCEGEGGGEGGGVRDSRKTK